MLLMEAAAAQNVAENAVAANALIAADAVADKT